MAFPVNDVLHWNDLATRQGERAARPISTTVSPAISAVTVVRDASATSRPVMAWSQKLLMPGRPWIISAPGGKMWASGV